MVVDRQKAGRDTLCTSRPLTDGVSVVFLIDKKNFEKAMVSGLSEETIAAIRDSEPHFDGRSYEIPIRDREHDFMIINTLVEIKLSD